MEESRKSDEDGNTDSDDADDAMASKMPADMEERSNADVVGNKSVSKNWEYMVVDEGEKEVSFAIRHCHGSALKMAVSYVFSTSPLMYVLVRSMGYSNSLYAFFLIRGARTLLIDMAIREHRQTERDADLRKLESVVITANESRVYWKKNVQKPIRTPRL